MILVTGGTGLVGGHLLYKLAKQNETIRATYRNKAKLKNVKAIFETYQKDYQALYDIIDWVKADITDIPALTDAMEGVDYVYHCAAFVSFEPDKYYQLRKINIEGTANMVNISLAVGVKKFCYVSSIAAVGTEATKTHINEETPWNPEANNNVYAITKYGAEMEVWRATQEGLNAVIVNPGVILGPGIWRYGTGSLFKKAHKGLKYYTSGNIGLISVNDVVNIMIILMHKNIHNERFILIAEDWKYEKFLKHLANAVHAEPPKKEAPYWLLQVGWRLDWLKRKLTGKRRILTKNLVQSLTTIKNYDTVKIRSTLDYNFQDIDTFISEVGRCYLKQAE
ncbi:NAD-dependent epimerase/dehydratase family protein [Gaetbulibacter aestuarii]|uniref:NAD-dependent epimerase/dehydratase family protein n=1 Tax=Gaetbulibacter aestuarii TaxID=1502358 RepID=A0ABW7MVZ1_9FLAO